QACPGVWAGWRVLTQASRFPSGDQLGWSMQIALTAYQMLERFYRQSMPAEAAPDERHRTGGGPGGARRLRLRAEPALRRQGRQGRGCCSRSQDTQLVSK